MFSQEWLQELLDKNDIVDVISKYIDLKPRGNKHWGCCPFHNEKTASFNVDSSKQLFYCFGCHKGGTVIQFIMEHEKLSYIEAITLLADKANIKVPSGSNNFDNDKLLALQKKHYEICKNSAKFYFDNLDNSIAIEYCKKRKLNFKIIKRFGIGYAPDKKDALFKHLLSIGFSKEDIFASGVSKIGYNNEVFDFLRNRLVFPIIDIYGNVIAFGGRVLDDSLPKYLNSADSKMYNKKRHLYGLNIAKKDKHTDRLILVEGYMDVVTVSSYGINGAIASLGTALTKEQCILIKRFTSNVYIAYDGDSAGRKATIKASKMLMEQGIMPKIIVFGQGLDPDEFLKKYGENKFNSLLTNCINPYKFEIDEIAKSFNLSIEEQRREFGLKATSVVSTISNELDKEDIIKYIEIKTGYSKDVISKQSSNMNKMEKIDKNNNRKSIQSAKISESLRIKAEKMAIKLCMNGYYSQFMEIFNENSFSTPDNKRLFLIFKDEKLNEKQCITKLGDDNIFQYLMEIINIEVDINNDKAIYDCFNVINNENTKFSIKELTKKLKDDSITKNEQLEILKKINELQIKLKHI